MARSGGGDGDTAVEELRRQLKELRQRLSELEGQTRRTQERLDKRDKEQADERSHERRLDEDARSRTDEASQKIKALDAVLARALAAAPLTFDAFKENRDEPAPDPADYQRGVPLLKRFGPGAAERRETARQADQGRYEAARDDHERRMSAAADRNARIEERRRALGDGDAAAVEWFISEVLARSNYPEGFPHNHRVSYQPGRAAVIAELELPPPEIVPRNDRYERQAGAVRPVRRPGREVRQQYKKLIACIALRTIHELFAATELYRGAVREVALTGWCAGREEAVGEMRTARLFSVSAERGDFMGLRLADEQPAECLTRTLGGLMSPDPFGLLPVEDAEPFPSD